MACLYFYSVSTLKFLFLTLLKVLELDLQFHSFPQTDKVLWNFNLGLCTSQVECLDILNLFKPLSLSESLYLGNYFLG